MIKRNRSFIRGKALTKPKVYVTRQLFKPAIDLLKKSSSVEIFEGDDDPVPREVLMRKVGYIDGLLCLITEKIDKEVFDAAKRLKVVSNYAVGFNNIDVDEASKRCIYITNTPGILTETTADCAFALMMAVSRRIVEGDKNIRSRKWVHAWGPRMFMGSDIHGKTLGIVGLGRIGVAMTRRAKGFDMNVVYYDPIRRVDLEKEYGIVYASLDDLLTQADFVSIHVPLTNKTLHLIGKEQFNLMKNTAYLINTSRGPVIDEKTLYEALNTRKIAGAGIDVFEKEPIDPKSPLIDLDNIVMTPHIASASTDTRMAMAMMAATNLIAVLEDREPPNAVNPEIKKKH
jgi:glyoxylate reductase